MDDLIRRQDAIEYFMTNVNWYDADGYIIENADEKRELLTDYFNGVPSALPKGRGRKFEEIVVEYPPADLCIYPEYRGKPYFSIKYKENRQHIIGFGTYNPEVFSRYLREFFITPTMSETKIKKDPIWEIMMIEHADKELVYPTGKHSGFPDIGCSMMAGFYHEKEQGIEALHKNALDIRETVYDAAFLLKRQPGLYQTVGSEDRIYFLWDQEKEGFFEAEEPKIFLHIAY